MKRIESFEELKAMQVAERAKMTVRDGLAPTEANLAKHQVLICAGTGCTSNKSAEVNRLLWFLLLGAYYGSLSGRHFLQQSRG